MSAEELSTFEAEVRAEVFRSRGFELEPAPEGKTIESIEVVVIDPFDERDPMPGFVNRLHVLSKAYVVKQTLSLREQSKFQASRAVDSVQSLRATEKFSLVLLTTALGSSNEHVRVVIIVKDIWSLRLNWNVEFVSGRLNLLLLNPAEVNLLGTHSTLGARYLLEPDRHTVGGSFFEPQIGPSNLGLYLVGGAIFERETTEPEGSFGYFQYFEPLQSRYQKWGWSVGMGWHNEVTRRYLGANIRAIAVRDEFGMIQRVLEVFDTERLAGEYELTRSFGSVNKTNVSFGIEADRRLYRAPDDIVSFGPDVVGVFERVVLPTSDTRISPFAQVRAYSTRFHRLLNVETLSLQEDFMLGHDTLLRVFPAAEGFGSSRSLLGVEWGAAYTFALATGLTRFKARARIELAGSNRNDVEFEAGARLLSPSTALGRLHVNVLALDRHRNYLNLAPYTLGGHNRLRGYEFNQFQGSKVLSANVELRSVPVEVLGVHLASVAFYDAGDTADAVSDLTLKHSLGVGGRVLLPQFDRAVFRVDWGLPLNPEYGGFPGGVTATFGQSFDLPGVDEPSVLDGVLPQ